MAHFAKLDSNNIVTDVIVISNDDLLDENGVEQESLGIKVCKNIFGSKTKWVQTSYTGSFRKQYAGVGAKYDKDNDVFIAPKPFESWILDENFDWQPPIEYPDDGKPYMWNEDTMSWIEIELPNA